MSETPTFTARCAHPADRTCDSRCNEGAATPFVRSVRDENDGPELQLFAHAWCIPRLYIKEGWKAAPNYPVAGKHCHCCAGSMELYPR